MKKDIICFSSPGREVVKQLNRKFEESGIEPARAFAGVGGDRDDDASEYDGFIPVTVDEFAKEGFLHHRVLIFVGAVGIAVRSIAPYIKDKMNDSPVIVIDDCAKHVIPILSGHAGGANKLAVIIASALDATAVITTSTDVNSAFSADVFARENNLKIKNRDGIKQVSAKAIEGKRVTISIKDYPPQEPVDIIIADETDREYTLMLSPKKYVVGIGMKKDRDPAEAEEYILSVLKDENIGIDDVYALSTVSVKENERAVKLFCDKYSIPLITFEASVLGRAAGEFSSSGFVKETVGVDNVCERAAVLASGLGGILVCRKRKGEGITIAIAERMTR